MEGCEMTCLLSKKEIDHSLFLISLRKPHSIRLKESSKGVFLDSIVLVVVIVLIAVVSFLMGQHCRTVTLSDAVNPIIWKEYDASRVKGH
jgi:hypothetical protein